METEYEVKVLDVDKEKILSLILSLGAEKVAELNMKRLIYHLDDRKWIRLRDNGKKVTLAIKHVESFNIDGTKEAEVEVKDFLLTSEILSQIGLKADLYQENKRTSFVLGNVKLELDEWPMIPPYLEIEGSSVEEVESALASLGISKESVTSIDVESVYRKYGLNLNSYKELKF